MQKISITHHGSLGTHDAMGRVVHALLYTQELSETRGRKVQPAAGK